MSKDGRTDPRLKLQIPIRFYSHDASMTELETRTQSTNISRSGLFMTSPKSLRVGGLLTLAMRVPPEVSGSVFSEFCCMCRVVHEQKMPDGELGYGLKIEAMVPRYQLGLNALPGPKAAVSEKSSSPQSGADGARMESNGQSERDWVGTFRR
jgi:hypothetical protein